ncbi:T9SS type A sorting domain-containing protein [Bacteroidota bacterium]
MRNIFLTAVILINIQIILHPQSPDTLWTKIHSISPNGDIDDPKCIRQTNDGGYIITGACVPDGLVSFVDVLLLKTDPMGNIVWTEIYGKGFVEEGLSVQQTSDGGYIIGGRAVTGSYPVIEPPISDIWILKTDENGDTLWTKTYGDSGNDYCTSVQQAADLGYVLTGTMNTEYCYPVYEINDDYEPDSSKAFLIKIDSNGNVLWEKTFLENSYSNCVVQTDDGGYIIAGWIFTDEENNQSDVLLIKTDPLGNELWTKVIGGVGNNIGLCVRETSDGYIISGQTNPEGQQYDALLIKTDPSGEVIWSKTFGENGSDAAFSVEVFSNEYFLTGTTNGTWWISASGDMWSFKTNTDGELLWEKILDIATNDIAWSGIITSDGGYALTGLAGYGFGGDLWLAKLAPDPTGIKNDKIPTSYLLYQNYPNPFNPTTKISYSIPQRSFVSLKVYDAIGNEIMTLLDGELTTGEHEIEFDDTEYTSGIYFYQLKSNFFSDTKKMLLIK